MIRFARLWLALMLCIASAPAVAQVAGQSATPPVRLPLDENGVDVLRGTFNTALADVTIGPDDHHGLAYQRINGTYSQIGTIEIIGANYVVTVAGRSDSFNMSTLVSTEANGATLVNAGGTYIYTSRDGIEARFSTNAGFQYQFYEGEFARLGSITYPDGTKHEFAWRVQTYCSGEYEGGICTDQLYYVARLQSVKNTNGYQLKIAYSNNKLTNLSVNEYAAWGTVTTVTAINNGVEYCDPVAVTCTLTGNWPKATYSGGTVTDPLGRPVKSYVIPTFDGTGKVATATRDGIAYGYGYADAGGNRTTTVTDPNGGQRVYTGSLTTFLVSSFRDELNRTTAYVYDANGRLTEATYPEGKKIQYTYDARGNATATRAISKTPGTPPDIVTGASYPASCTNPKTCNKPLTATDPRGAVTDYT